MQAPQAVLTEWRIGGVTLRDLVLRELAAAYRHLRERGPMMDPVAVPTTSAAWTRDRPVEGRRLARRRPATRYASSAIRVRRDRRGWRHGL